MENNKNIRVLVFGQFFAVFGSKFLDLVMGVIYIEFIKSSADLNIGFFNALLVLPCLFIIIPAADLTIFCSRKNMVIFSNIIMFIITITMFILQEQRAFLFANGLGLAMAQRTAEVQYRIVLDCAVREMSPSFKYIKISNVFNGISITLAPVIGGVIYLLFGISAAFLASSILFVISGVLALFIKNGIEEKLSHKIQDKFKYEKVKSYIMYDSNKKLEKMVKISMILNTFFVSIFMCAVPVILNSVGLRISTLSGSLFIILAGVTIIIYVSSFIKDRTVSLNLIVLILFISTAVLGAVFGFVYYLLLKPVIFELIFYFTLSFAGVCFTMANVYTYLEFRQLVNKDMAKDFYVYHLFNLTVAIIAGNLLIGILLSFFPIGITMTIVSLFAMAFLQSLGKINVSK